jgi:hypothetical protein
MLVRRMDQILYDYSLAMDASASAQMKDDSLESLAETQHFEQERWVLLASALNCPPRPY